MSRWFPAVDHRQGIRNALDFGIGGAVAFALVQFFTLAYVVFSFSRLGEISIISIGMLIGSVLQLAVILGAAWRFKIGKGLVWGSFVLFLLLLTMVAAVMRDKSLLWLIVDAPIAAALINGLRGARAARKLPSERDYAEVFE